MQELQRMGVWDAIQAGATAAIREVHVSQQQPTVLWPGQGQPEVCITAAEQRVPQLGAVVVTAPSLPRCNKPGKPPVPNARNT